MNLAECNHKQPWDVGIVLDYLLETNNKPVRFFWKVLELITLIWVLGVSELCTKELINLIAS